MSFLWSPGRSGGRENPAENSWKDLRGNHTHLLPEAVLELHCARCASGVLLCNLPSHYLLTGTHEKGKSSMRVGWPCALVWWHIHIHVHIYTYTYCLNRSSDCQSSRIRYPNTINTIQLVALPSVHILWLSSVWYKMVHCRIHMLAKGKVVGLIFKDEIRSLI